jgi:signal-transduction protein with cAMP-binding, CBS, and nucleotidyltransferase domain
MKTLRDIIQAGGGVLSLLQTQATVADAVRLMDEKNVGIVAILDGQRLVGLVSERDVVRRVVRTGRAAAETKLADIMTTNLVVSTEDEDYRIALQKLDQANSRHLPVVRGDTIISMLSIRDLIRVDMERISAEIKFLHAYLYQVPPSVGDSDD